jgi:hypothetical protein
MVSGQPLDDRLTRPITQAMIDDDGVDWMRFKKAQRGLIAR